VSNAGGELRDRTLRTAADGLRPLRRASDRTPLGSILGRIERAFADGEHALVVELLDRDPLAAWYGFPPDRLGQMIEVLQRSGAPEIVFLKLMGTMFSGEAAARVDEDAGPDPSESSDRARIAELGGRLFTLRVQGRPVEALHLTDEFERLAGSPLQPIFDGSGGWSLFNAVQHGVTAMLAGEFARALRCFTQARLHVRLPALVFLARDACVKSAIIEALYGSHRRARALLDEAAGIERTESWAEGLIDAGESIASAVLRAEDPEEALGILDAVPLHEVGEMWPFYVDAVQRVLLLDSRLNEARRRLALFEQLPLPRVDGQGYAGSVLQLSGALRSIMSGDIADARERIASADASLVVTEVLAAVLELAAGRPRAALRRTAGQYERTEGLRFLDLWRAAVNAGAHLALGSEEECRSVLNAVIGLPGGLTSQEASYFPAEVRRFAEARFEAWPREGDGAGARFDVFPAQGDVLTLREQEVLRELARGHSREEIARSQFISVNTLKAHLRSIYRKLGVNSRGAAVIEAERRGIA